ncbi:ATP-binding SpoIIE family protein phosphatase [Streptomyces carpaticus]|uniref:ATP-binding SpoIIE family protein phosphatase n=1 Tax=Streptomyces carpaticus TaxID=285558 RepID=UPI0035C17ADD
MEQKDQTIRLLQEIDRARRAFQASEQGRLQALSLATLLFSLLGRTQAQVAELRREADSLRFASVSVPERATADQRLLRAVQQERDLHDALLRAEQERNTAQQVADHAARRIRTLEEEIALLKSNVTHLDRDFAQADGQLPVTVGRTDTDDALLDDVDQVLLKASSVLDREHEAVREAAEEIGLHSTRSGLTLSSELFRTTPNNMPPGGAEGGVPGQRSMPSGFDRSRFIGVATRKIARGEDCDEIILGLCRATVPTFADAILLYLLDPLPIGDQQPARWVFRLRRTDCVPPRGRGLSALGTGSSESSESKEGVFGGEGTPDSGTVDCTSLTAREDLALRLISQASPQVELLPNGRLAEVLRGVRPVFTDSKGTLQALSELTYTETMSEGHHAILAPLRGKRRVIGVAVFLRRSDNDVFEKDDLQVAQQLSSHAALSIEKSMMHRREAAMASELQLTMLPDGLPQLQGVKLASRYLSASQSTRVGGDWYDAIPLPGSRVALVVGDVMGHSTTSAAIMGQLRTTVQTLAGLDLPPQEVLHHLDEQAQRLGDNRMATCLYAVYDPVAHRITAANAGHPPPVLLHRDGTTEVVNLEPNAPIGVGGVDFQTVELPAPPGSTLVLYTDGLVESRTRDVWTGIEHLRGKLSGITQTMSTKVPLESLCDDILDIAGPGDRDDDIVLLAARLEGIAPGNEASLELEPRPESVRHARRLVRESLAGWDLTELEDAVELLVSEVVTNAVRYAERPVSVRLLRTDVLRCEVDDDVPRLPRLRQAGPYDEVGRGLYLVQRLAHKWGAARLSTGKLVWFEMSLPAALPTSEALADTANDLPTP